MHSRTANVLVKFTPVAHTYGMKIAVLSDIHANPSALEAIGADIEAWSPDFVVVNGDIVNRGPRPADCWEYVQEKVKHHGWQVTIGNHEEYVLNHLNPDRQDKHFPMSWWTLGKMRAYIEPMRNLPAVWSHTHPEGREVRATHASMSGSRVGLNPQDSIDKVRLGIAPAPAVLVVGHIHMPYVRPVDKTLLVNSGSAGQPCYGEKKGCYARITWENGGWNAEIQRVAYDRAKTQQQWFESGIFDETDLMTHIIYHEWRTARPFMLKWFFEYAPILQNEDVSEDELFAHFLDQENLGRATINDPL